MPESDCTDVSCRKIGEAAPLLLLGRDQLLGQAGALRLAHLRLGEQACVLDRPAGEVGEQPGARRHPRGRTARCRARRSARDLLVARPQRDHDDVLGRRGRAALARRQEARARLEQTLRLPLGDLEDLTRVERRRDRRHRLDERLEEARLGRELALDQLVAPALGGDRCRVSAPTERPDMISPAPSNARSSSAKPMAESHTPPTRAASSAALIDDRFAKRNRHRVRAGVRLELGEDVADMALHGLLADEETGRRRRRSTCRRRAAGGSPARAR